MARNASPFNMLSAGIIRNTYDSAANDSDKTFVVPDGATWELMWAHVSLVSTATVGNRQIRMAILDDDGVERADIHAGAVQAASLTRHYLFMKGVYRETAFVDDEMHVPFPHDLILHAGWQIRIYDESAVAAAADDMTVSFQVIERDI